jgi:hypothetical protein
VNIGNRNELTRNEFAHVLEISWRAWDRLHRLQKRLRRRHTRHIATLAVRGNSPASSGRQALGQSN